MTSTLKKIAGHHFDSQALSGDSLITISSLLRTGKGSRANYSVWHTYEFTHLFNVNFGDLQLAKSNIISAVVNNNLREFTISISQHF